MPRYQLKDKCLFVDAYVYDEQTRKPSTKKPDAIPSPHILDQGADPATCLKLNDAAAFIARFIVLGVDTSIIPQIVQSEYPGAGGIAADEVDGGKNLDAALSGKPTSKGLTSPLKLKVIRKSTMVKVVRKGTI